MKYNKQISFGTDASGKRIRKWFHANSLPELADQVKAYKEELERASTMSDITFEDYYQTWFAVYKSHLARSTKLIIEHNYKKCEKLKPFMVREITKTMCQECVNASWDHPHTAKGMSDLLRQVFRTAVSDGIITSNPAEHLSRPKMKPSRFHLLTKEELEAVKTADLSDQDRLLVTILQVFGLRPGEALALTPGDFDFKHKVLKITKALEMPNDGKSGIKSTKTGVSREIPIPDQLITPLRKQIQSRMSFYLFTKRDGGLHTKNSYKRLSARILKAVNVQLGGTDLTDKTKEITLYSFRHRRATDLYYLAQSGAISTKRAAELMGHSEIVFLKTYSHVDMEKESKNIYKNFDFSSVTNL